MGNSYVPWDKRRSAEVSELAGMVLSSVTANEEEDEILFKTADGRAFLMYHEQDCCERVSIESIVGDLSDLVGEPILQAEEATSDKNPEGVKPEYQDESFTWTFYKFATRKGYVDIRWFGGSNGYYSERVDFVEVLP